MKNSLNILIGGEAGQGLVTIGELLAKSLVRSGYSIVVTQSYQSRIRGGHNTYMIRVSPEEISSPRESIDILVALDQNTLTLHQNEVSASGFILIDQGFWCDGESCLKIPYKQLASERYSNVVALGVLGSLLGIDQDLLLKTLGDFFGKKDPKAGEENRRVLVEAFRWGSQKPSNHKLPPAPKASGRMMMNGNEAIAFGAISAGLKFYSFYPMTPATTIGQTLAGYAGKMGLVVEQAEDEIAAINMAIGASFAGAPSMVGTSGGGFALMVEGVSLAAMTETPVVVVVAQRPGPATGLPTRTEQGDLNFVLHAGHGEFPRAIFAPGSVEECFELTRKAFFLADKYQGPMFLLTDQFLADSARAIAPFENRRSSLSSNLRPQPLSFGPVSTVCPYQGRRFTAPHPRAHRTPGGGGKRRTPRGWAFDGGSRRSKNHGGKKTEKGRGNPWGGYASRIFREQKPGSPLSLVGIHQGGRSGSGGRREGTGKNHRRSPFFPGLAFGSQSISRLPSRGERGCCHRRKCHRTVRRPHPTRSRF